MRQHLFRELLHLVQRLVDRAGAQDQAGEIGAAGSDKRLEFFANLVRRTDQVDVLDASQILVLEGRLPQRQEVVVQPARAELLHSLLVRAANAQRDLWRDLDAGWIS